MSQRTNEEWVTQLQDNTQPDVHETAIEDLRQRLQRGIYYYLSRERSDLVRTSTEDLNQMAQDFAQDAVLRVLKNIHTFRGDSKFTTWAMKIASRVAVSELRRARYRDFSLDDITNDGEIMLHLTDAIQHNTKQNAPERATEREDLVRIIDRAFNEVLTERQRIALEAVSLRGVPMDVVAEQLDTNRNALYKLLHDARKKLKTHLEEEGLAMDYVMQLFSS
ncbi:MAG: RNA polymerase sigma factor [Anaerolineales bacterium]